MAIMFVASTSTFYFDVLCLIEDTAMTIFTFEKLYKAYQDCLKHKKNTVNVCKFEIKREENLCALLADLKSRKYKISRHVCFIVTEPSPREVFAAHFRDRIVHHLLCNEIEMLFEQNFLDSSYANRKGKGTHKAVKKLRWYTIRGGIDGKRLYYVKLDITSFFRSIDKEILWQLIEKRINDSAAGSTWKEEVSWIARKIVFHNPAGNYIFKGHTGTKDLLPQEKSLLWGNQNKGLPIGNLTSQFFANVYLHELDYFIEEDLGFNRYVRYVDDFVILDEDYEKLAHSISLINQFLKRNLKLRLCEDKTKLQCTKNGIDFLGYYLKPTHTLVRQKVVKRFKKKLYQFETNSGRGIACDANEPMVQSYLGHFSHANSFNLINTILDRYITEQNHLD
ncbi:MAG: reverse transcriptase/maturase family protein [Patescibacteria group bacterium]